MKSMGIIRKLDDLGRVVIPKEIRDEMKLEYLSPLEIFYDGKGITFVPYTKRCICCGSDNADSLVEVDRVSLCPDCIRKFGGGGV